MNEINARLHQTEPPSALLFQIDCDNGCLMFSKKWFEYNLDSAVKLCDYS